ncbi:FG-GAP repeat protein [Streptomyces sp. NPDC102487]|uniref:FG-GAP repeat protein n=1 Tax=Streptomyces sp. NPDC102487 TaxID=3366182 RepID=UPI0038219931
MAQARRLGITGNIGKPSPHADQSAAAIGDVTGDGRNDLVGWTFGAVGGRGTVWLVPDMMSPRAGEVHPWTLDSPGVPGRDVEPSRSARTPDHLQLVGPLLDTDGDGRMDVVVASFVDGVPLRPQVDEMWELRGTSNGMAFRGHFVAGRLLR